MDFLLQKPVDGHLSNGAHVITIIGLEDGKAERRCTGTG